MNDGKIEAVLNEVRRVWQNHPYLRLGQLIVNAANPAEPCPEVFYLDDHKLYEKLKRYV